MKCKLSWDVSHHRPHYACLLQLFALMQPYRFPRQHIADEIIHFAVIIVANEEKLRID